MVQGIDVAAAAGERMLVLTTGDKCEQYAMALYPDLPEAAFIQVGDFIGVGVRRIAGRRRLSAPGVEPGGGGRGLGSGHWESIE